MRQYEMKEFCFLGPPPTGSMVQIDLWGEFTWEEQGEERKRRVKGFYAGDGSYKIRFLPLTAGTYNWKITGCIQAQGGEECIPAGTNAHGMVRAEGNHFVFEDGSNYFPFGTTVYALAHQEEALEAETMESLARAPFNKVRFCLFPKHYDYNHNEPRWYAFEKKEDGTWDVNRPCFTFWDHFEKIIFGLADIGIQSDLILFHPYDRWGFSRLGMEENLVYLDYLLRRFSAIPQVWWSLANEFDLMSERTLADWHTIERYIAENDPYRHLLSNHNCFGFYDFHRKAVTHACVQSAELEKAEQWMKEYNKPLIYDECCYEGNLPMDWGDLSGFEMVNRFWKAYSQGAYTTHGEAFLSEDDILWWAKGGKLKGESPLRISFLRKLAEEIGSPLEPWDQLAREDLLQEQNDKELLNRLSSMSESQKEAIKLRYKKFTGHVGERIYLQYLARHCSGELSWSLPEDKKYEIEVIDVWNMTRRTVAEAASGRIVIRLPGKEGIAVLGKERK